MANLDISERRIPQDGRIRCTVQGRKLDLRMSTLPVGSAGEKTVMRILDTKSINVKLESLPVAGELQIRDYVPKEELGGTTLRGKNQHADDEAFAA